MASTEIVSNLKLITSGNVPTTSNLGNGELAFGLVDGVAKLYGNVNGTIVDFSDLSATYIPVTQKGANNGVASLDATGKVPSAQLPSYVDDVLEFDSRASFPQTGEEGKIYVDTTTNKTYRWGGTSYVEISASLALGETASTAYAGDKGKKNADDIAAIISGTQKVASATTANNATNASHATNADHATSADSVYKTNSTGTGALYPLLSQNASVGFGQPVQDLDVKVQGRMLYDNRGLLASNSDLSETKGIVAAKLEFMGEWTTGLAEPNTLWEYNNMFWVAKNATEDAPSELSDDWQLLNTTAAGINVSPAGGSLRFYLLGTGTKGTLDGAVVRNLSSAGYEVYAQSGELYDKRGKVASESEVVAQVTAIDTSTTYATRTLTMDGLTSYSQLVGKRIRVEIPSAPAGTTYFHFQTSASTVNINGLGALPLYFRIGGTLIQGASNNTAGNQIIASGSNVTGFPRPTWYELLYVPDGGGRFECTELISRMASSVYDGLMSSSNYRKLANIDTSKLNDLPASRWTGRERCDPDYGVDVSGYFDRDGMYLVTLELMNNGNTATYASVWMLYTADAGAATADIPAMKGSPVNAGAENLLVTGRVIIDGGYQMTIWGTGAFDPATGQEDTSQDPSYALQDSYVTGIYFLCGM